MTADTYQISREQLLTILSPVDFALPTQNRRPRLALSWVGMLGAALIVATINLPAFWRIAQQVAPAPITGPTILAAPETKTIAQAAAISTKPEGLHFDALSINAPIIWDSAYDSKTMLTNLESGVVQLAGSAKPGQNGTMIISGHSSYYLLAKGDYKEIFASLPKATLGQKIVVTYHNQDFEYEVTDIYEVTPDRTDLLVSGTTPLLRLITCTPVGTNLRRLIVDAKQVSPDPNSNTAFSGPKLTASTILATR